MRVVSRAVIIPPRERDADRCLAYYKNCESLPMLSRSANSLLTDS